MVGGKKTKEELQFLSLSAVGGLAAKVEASGLRCQQNINKPKRAMSEKEAAALTATENSSLARA